MRDMQERSPGSDWWNELLASPPTPAGDPKPSGSVVVLNTYAAEPARHGGQVRVNRLMRRLGRASMWTTCCHRTRARAFWSDLSGRVAVDHRTVRRSRRAIEGRIAGDAGVPVGDVAALLTAQLSSDLLERVANATKQCDAVVLEHPYLYPLVRDLGPGRTDHLRRP